MSKISPLVLAAPGARRRAAAYVLEAPSRTLWFAGALGVAAVLTLAPAHAQQDSGPSGFHTTPTQTQPKAPPDSSTQATHRNPWKPIDHGNPKRTQESQYLNNPNASMMHKD